MVDWPNRFVRILVLYPVLCDLPDLFLYGINRDSSEWVSGCVRISFCLWFGCQPAISNFSFFANHTYRLRVRLPRGRNRLAILLLVLSVFFPRTKMAWICVCSNQGTTVVDLLWNVGVSKAQVEKNNDNDDAGLKACLGICVERPAVLDNMNVLIACVSQRLYFGHCDSKFWQMPPTNRRPIEEKLMLMRMVRLGSECGFSCEAQNERRAVMCAEAVVYCQEGSWIMRTFIQESANIYIWVLNRSCCVRL